MGALWCERAHRLARLPSRRGEHQSGSNLPARVPATFGRPRPADPGRPRQTVAVPADPLRPDATDHALDLTEAPLRTTLYRGGSVYSPTDPFATAMVVAGDTVAWVGSDEAARAQVGQVDDVIELDGALVTPAFVDGHVHTTDTGLALTGVPLSEARSLTEALEMVERASRASAGRPVIGHGWDETAWPEGRPPTRTELDRASHGGVVYLSRVDVHSAVVSSALAQAVGLRDHDGWSDSGRVERDAHMVVRDATRTGMAPEVRRELQSVALRAAAAAGIATLHEMAAPHIVPRADTASLAELGDDPTMPDVLTYRGEFAADPERALALVAEMAAEGITVAGLAGDLNIDGSVGSRTAAFSSPYADDTRVDHCGHLYLDPEQVATHLVACTEAGLQGGFHVIGDAGVDVGRRGAAAGGGPCRRGQAPRCEAPAGARRGASAEDASVLADLGVSASVQPVFDEWWGGPSSLYVQRLGRQRGGQLNRIGSMAAAGVVLAFGSDSPVTPFDPWGAVRAAVFHHDPAQRISARAAFAAHTRGAHRAARRDGEGVLALGSTATFAVWEPTDLVVQAPDARVAAWSTDERSGTPGLPDLTPGVATPACRQTVLRGRTVFAAG